jgi:hypothetical protein
VLRIYLKQKEKKKNKIKRSMNKYKIIKRKDKEKAP